MDIKQRAILLRFPEFNDVIVRQINENEDFESLCADYELCMNMLAALEREKELRQQKLEEYLEIKKELEEEVLKYLH